MMSLHVIVLGLAIGAENAVCAFGVHANGRLREAEVNTISKIIITF